MRERKIDVPTAELDDILATISQGRVAGVAQRILRGQHDIVVIEAKADRQNGFVSWTMKRLTGRSEPGTHRREIPAQRQTRGAGDRQHSRFR